MISSMIRRTSDLKHPVDIGKSSGNASVEHGPSERGLEGLGPVDRLVGHQSFQPRAQLLMALRVAGYFAEPQPDRGVQRQIAVFVRHDPFVDRGERATCTRASSTSSER